MDGVCALGAVFEMIVDLNSFERERAINATIPTGAIDLDLETAKVVSDVEINGKLTKTAASTTLVGRLAGEMEILCDRCLEPQLRSFDVELDLEFATKDAFGAAANLELQPNELKLDAIPEDKIDLTEIAREQILLDVPQQFFCREDCQGLCQKCGTNLNTEQCDCEENEIDPRWAALKNLN